jgi:isoleucyl-tRNA synthetase
MREAGRIGSSLQAELDLYATGASHALLASLGDDLKFVTITSRATLHHATPADPMDESVPVRIVVTPSVQPKCERCWHWRADVGSTPAHPTLCGRCVVNLFGSGEPRTVA